MSKNLGPYINQYYTFRVVVEPDDGRWFAHCPLLEAKGAATWGQTQEEALKNIQEVLQMVLKSMAKHGEAIPNEPVAEVRTVTEPWVSVAV